MARDRVFINSSYRKSIDEMKDKDIFCFHLGENKDSFLLAVALGIDNPEPIKGKKEGWFLLKSLKTSDKALLASVLLGTANNDEEVNEFADFDKALDLCEECAETGFRELFKKFMDAEEDTDLMQRRMMKELDMLYTMYFEADI